MDFARQKTSAADVGRIDAMFQKNAPLLMQLSDRWADEREYENIADYAGPIRAALPEGFQLVRMKKRPFGFEFAIENGALYQMTANARQVAWKRI